MLPLLFKQHIVCSNCTQRMKVRVHFFYMSVVLHIKNDLQNDRIQLKILTKSLSPEVQIPGYEADHSSQFSAKVNGWPYTVIPQSFSWLARGGKGGNLPAIYVFYLQQEGQSIQHHQSVSKAQYELLHVHLYTQALSPRSFLQWIFRKFQNG